ncbi:unnamed protein product [Adineta ricciae]|uniref:F-box domain-containing protein n=1 Tax=Adineta ricciae TaxID=249248 RepID=A0A815IIW9_ADIRI|nr:unnamed protein product [Adineta ricciae]
MLELLPDELLLLIFCYLHKFDVIYTFTNLNSRFQQIIASFLFNVNFTQQYKPSYKKFQWFCDNVVPLHENSIHSLKLEESHQLLALRTYISDKHETNPSQPVLHQLNHLKSLVLEMEGGYDIHHENELNNFLLEALKISSLTELSVSLDLQNTDLVGTHTNRIAKIFESMALSTSNKITNLTLIYPRGLLRLDSTYQICSIKQLSVKIYFAKMLIELFNATPNLQELNLSIVMFDDTEPLKSIKLPEKLEKLHIEGGTYDYRTYSHEQPTFEMIKGLLDVFKYQLRSLALIVNNADENFANYNKFQSLICNFTCLCRFEYHIRTNCRPNSLFPNIEQLPDLSFSIFTIPRLRQFDKTSLRITYVAEFNSDLSIQELYNCQLLSIYSENCDSSVLGALKKGVSITKYCAMKFCLAFCNQLEGCRYIYSTLRYPHFHSYFFLKSNAKLVNLKKLSLTSTNKTLSIGFGRLLLKIIGFSPGLTDLLVGSGTTNVSNLIKQLQKIIPQKEGKQFLCFEMFVDMKSKKWDFSLELSKMLPNLKTIGISGEQRSIDNCFSSLIEFVEDLQTHFKELVRLTIKTYAGNHRSFQRYENDLKILSKQTKNPIYYSSKDQGMANYFFDIWL